jgi:hypothetical protein
MQSEKHKGYILWGHAVLLQEDVLQPERYAASGTIARDSKVVETSGVLDDFETEEEAEAELADLPGRTRGSTTTGERSTSLKSPGSNPI